MLCPDLAITRDAITGQIIIDLNYCKGCGICAWVCPKGAIRMVVGEST
jgi:pyruvate ferredoxin oxidoreductase delta subunit